MRVQTTHDPAGGGRPRLVFSSGGRVTLGSEEAAGRQREFALLPGGVTIGSAADSDLRLDGLDDHHAEVRRDDGDDYVLHHLGRPGAVAVNGRVGHEAALHSGDRVTLGRWSFTYLRDEYADHGRPNGGRQGGELSAGPRIGA